MKITSKELENLHATFGKCGPVFIALGDEIRQKIILDILDAGEGGLNVMTLTSRSRLSRPAISHHLKVLKNSGLVSSVKKGTQVFYRITIAENFGEVIRLMQSTLEIMERAMEARKKEAAL